MTGEECFAAWAPDGAVWSRWAKPVLFAQLENLAPPHAVQMLLQIDAEKLRIEKLPEGTFDVSALPEARAETALIVDLAGIESVQTGIELSKRGYRPVPLYNTSVDRDAVIDVQEIVLGLRAGADSLQRRRLSPTAPPAFLLDCRRMKPKVPVVPGRYDNRWVVFPQDFPSATFLRANGVGQVLVLQDQVEIAEDLAHVLLRWQEAGIGILAAGRNEVGRPRQLQVKPPSRFRRAWHRALTLAGLQRNDAGGFGALVPTPSSGGYG